MNHNDSLEYARARLDLAKQMGDTQEMEKWSEHVWHWTEVENNDRLIDAAPELLEALLGCVEFMDSIGITNDKPNTDAARRLKVARAAIRKAEGRKA